MLGPAHGNSGYRSSSWRGSHRFSTRDDGNKVRETFQSEIGQQIPGFN